MNKLQVTWQAVEALLAATRVDPRHAPSLLTALRLLEKQVLLLHEATVPTASRFVDQPLCQQEVVGCKALLLEIIRRASYDWVLYRQSSRIPQKRLAEDAYHWLFVEETSEERKASGKHLTGFVAICDLLDLDPEMVRARVRTLTVANVMSVGRPAEYRRQDWRDTEESFSPGHIDSDTLEREHGFSLTSFDDYNDS